MKQVTKKVDLIHSIRKVTVIIFTVGALAFAMLGLLDRVGLVRNDTIKIRSDYTDRQKQIIKTQVKSTVMFITLAKDSGVSGEDIIESVRKIRFGDGNDGYIFIVTYDGTTLLNDTQRQLEGKNIWDLTDPNGVKVIQEERRAVQNPDGDFIYYSWNQPSTGVVTPKVSFMKGIEEWEWMVGSGVYLGSLEREIAALQKDEIIKTGMLVLILIVILSSLLFIVQLTFKRFTGAVADEIRLFSSYFDSASANSEEIDISNIRYREFSLIAEDMNRMVKNNLEAANSLQESLEEKKILLKEVHHRVKNNMAIISSFISLQSMNIEDEYVRSLLQSSENRVRSMALIHEHLYKSENLRSINIQTYIDELLMTLLDSYGYNAADISTKTEIIQCELDLDLLIPLGMLINEIISNALKHAFTNIDSPELSIGLVEGKPGELILTINDNGIGLPLESEINQNDSIGFMLINGLVQQINSKMEILRENGTEYRITIPI